MSEMTAPPGIPVGAVISDIGFLSFQVGSTLLHIGTGPNSSTITGTGIARIDAGQFSVVAKSGDTAPDGGTFRSFSTNPFLNAGGVGLFTGTTAASTSLYMTTPGHLDLLVAQGQPAPGYPGATLSAQTIWGINSSGTIAFTAFANGPQGSTKVLWTITDGVLAKLVGVGDPAPGTNGMFASILTSPPDIVLADNDYVAFTATVLENGSTTAGIWAGKPGAISLVARVGQQAPGYPDGTTYAFLNLPFAINARGQVVFEGNVSGTNAPDRWALFATSPCGPVVQLFHGNQSLATTNDPALPVTTFDIYALGGGGHDGQPTWFNDAGQFVFRATLPGTSNYALVAGSLIDTCYANCDGSTTPPIFNVADFTCFLQKFAAADPYANCDGSTTPPVLNVADFTCFLERFALATR
jgi:hypothetical protein